MKGNGRERGEGKGRGRLLQFVLWFALNRVAHLIKKELQLFVGKVDAQLLEAVVVEFLKAENIQNACKCKTGGRQVREGREGREASEGGEGREGREGGREQGRKGGRR